LFVFVLHVKGCWNCGRKALETCSGCNMARYCSAFCQHKDWENHHNSCGRNAAAAVAAAAAERASGASGETKSCHSHENNSSSPINVSNPSPECNSSPPGSKNN